MKKTDKTFKKLEGVKLTNDQIKKIVGGEGSSSSQTSRTFQDRT